MKEGTDFPKKILLRLLREALHGDSHQLGSALRHASRFVFRDYVPPHTPRGGVNTTPILVMSV